jgi:predicted nucleic acid-binding protein
MGRLMVAVSRLYTDTNVFIALGEGSDEISTLLFQLVDRQMPGQSSLFTSELTLAELLVLPHRQHKDELIKLYDNWVRASPWLNVGPVSRDVLWHASRIRAGYASIKLPDAIHVAFGFGCSHFLTGDRRLPNELELPSERQELESGPIRLKALVLDKATVAGVLAERQP